MIGKSPVKNSLLTILRLFVNILYGSSSRIKNKVFKKYKEVINNCVVKFLTKI